MTRSRLNVWAVGLALGVAVCGAAAPPAGSGEKERPSKVVVTSPQVKDVVVTQRYPGQVHAQRHIKVSAMMPGYLEAVPVKEGQAVRKGDVLFKVVPTLYQAKLEVEQAEFKIAQLELENAKKLFKQNVISVQELALSEAKMRKAQAKAKLAEAELSFTTVRAPFDGLVGSLEQQEGSLVKQGDALATLSDNSALWVYFNVPEARYLESMAGAARDKEGHKVELVLANGRKFPQPGKLSGVSSDFSSETGNIAFRADFPNPDRLLRHGQTGTVLVPRTLKNVTVIPQRAAFSVLDREYVFVVGKDGVARQREIVVGNEVDDAFVVKKGLDAADKIVLEGARQVHDGDKVEFEFRKPGE